MHRTSRRPAARLIALTALAILSLAASALWSASASAQPSKPPLLLYGAGEAGDTVAVFDADGAELDDAEVQADGTWHLLVEVDSDDLDTLSFQLNGEAVEAEINQTGELLAEVALSAPAASDAMEEDSMMEDDSMMEEDDSMMEDEDSTMDEGDSMMDEDESMEEEQIEEAFPESGTGGLADEGPSTSALIGTIAVLLTLAVGLGAWRLRQRV